MKKDKRFKNPFKAMISSLYHRYCEEEVVSNSKTSEMPSPIQKEHNASGEQPTPIPANVVSFPSSNKRSTKPLNSNPTPSQGLDLKKENPAVSGTCFKCQRTLTNARRSGVHASKDYFYVACTCGFVMKQSSQALFPTYYDKSEVNEAYNLFAAVGMAPKSYAMTKDGVRVSF